MLRSLRPLGHAGDLLLLGQVVGRADLLQVVDDHQRGLAVLGDDVLDGRGDDVERRLRRRRAVDVQPRGVVAHRGQRLDAADVLAEPLGQAAGGVVGRLEGGAHLPHVERHGLVERLRGLGGDDLLQQGLGLELEGQEDHGPTRPGAAASHLQRERRLALALGAGQQVERPGAQPAAELLVEQRESGRPQRRSGLGIEQATVHSLEYVAQGGQLRVHREISARRPGRARPNAWIWPCPHRGVLFSTKPKTAGSRRASAPDRRFRQSGRPAQVRARPAARVESTP